jgi:hypothetical protein
MLQGKYVVGRQIFVERHLVDRLLSKNFRRHRHAEVEELLRVLNFFLFQTIQLLNLGSEGEGHDYKITSDKVRMKAKISKLDHKK